MSFGENSLLRRFDGPLTQELAVLAPGGLGLGKVPLPLVPTSTTTMTCGFCSTGCGLRIHLKDGEAVGLTPDTDYPVNLGMACPKGWEALNVLRAPDRATTPLLRSPRGNMHPVDWDTALRTFAERFKGIQERYGPESVAWIGTGQIATEELALLGVLGKFGMGIVHGDSNTRQCMATSAVAYKQSIGFDAPPYTYDDFEESDVIILIGSNICIAHPIMWERILRNKRKPTIIVIDPRKTETAMAATLHVPLAPKGDLALLYSLANVLIRNGWIDRDFVDAHTNGFEEFAAHVAAFAPEAVSEQTGVESEVIERIARIIQGTEAASASGGKPRVSFWWTMGVNQSYEGVRVAQAIINLALMTGNIGKPGTGANSITGQCNAMGSRLFSNTTNLLGGRDFENPDDRRRVAELLGIEESRIPTGNSLAYNEIVEGISAGKIKGLWVIGTNSLHSWIGQNDFRRILSKLEFLVVQDMYHSTESAQHAHLLLPAAGWGEKDGTFINSERRLGVLRKVAKAPGEALSDFSIFKLVAHYWGCADLFEKWESPAAVFEILKKLSEGRPCDISGIEGYEHLQESGGIQWPYPETARADAPSPALPRSTGGGSELPGRRLFADGKFFHQDGKAKFLFEQPRKMPEPANQEYPYILLTGRGTSAQWHTQTRTGKSAVLRQLAPQSTYVEINPEDARGLDIRAGEVVCVQSRRGQIQASAVLTPCMQSGQVFLPMHYAATNHLTDPVFDPYSKQPSYKACAVKIRKIEHWERLK